MEVPDKAYVATQGVMCEGRAKTWLELLPSITKPGGDGKITCKSQGRVPQTSTIKDQYNEGGLRVLCEMCGGDGSDGEVVS